MISLFRSITKSLKILDSIKQEESYKSDEYKTELLKFFGIVKDNKTPETLLNILRFKKWQEIRAAAVSTFSAFLERIDNKLIEELLQEKVFLKVMEIIMKGIEKKERLLQISIW